ncbi:MAG: tetratricopeptide repeat protein [Candidatus Thiodiazotropha sp.]|jgi:tetratricopeptide (TPR) repeat protein
MPKFNTLTWIVILIGEITYGLMVYAITRGYYEQRPVVALSASEDGTQVSPLPASNPLGDTLLQNSGPMPTAEDLTTDDPALIAQLADNYFTQKEYEEAIKLYERVLKINPNDVESYNDLGLALFYTAQPERAVDILQTGIQKDPEFQRIRLTLGFVQSQTGDKESAAAALSKAIALGPDNGVGKEAKRMLEAL